MSPSNSTSSQFSRSQSDATKEVGGSTLIWLLPPSSTPQACRSLHPSMSWKSQFDGTRHAQLWAGHMTQPLESVNSGQQAVRSPRREVADRLVALAPVQLLCGAPAGTTPPSHNPPLPAGSGLTSWSWTCFHGDEPLWSVLKLQRKKRRLVRLSSGARLRRGGGVLLHPPPAPPPPPPPGRGSEHAPPHWDGASPAWRRCPCNKEPKVEIKDTKAAPPPAGGLQLRSPSPH